MTSLPRPLAILVADDNRDAADTLHVLLQMNGHAVTTVHDGVAAVDAARRLAPDLAILDIGMPHMDGFGAAARIRADSPRTLLVALSGYADANAVARGREAGFDHHLAKPLDLGRLQAILTGLPGDADDPRSL